MKILLIVVAMLWLAFTGAAQDATSTPDTEPSPFLHALSLIPDTPAVRAGMPLFSYADYHASIASRGLTVPESFSAREPRGNNDDPVVRALAGGAYTMLQYVWIEGANYPQTVGFDFFQVRQAVEMGTSPLPTQILIGHFDPAAIHAAYTQRDYEVERQDEQGMLLCPFGDCAAGMVSDPVNYRNPANPFGGAVGRNELMFVGNGVLLNSASTPELDAMIDTYTGSAPSLADDPAFVALANVLDEYPYVNVVTAYSPLELGTPAVLAFTRDQGFVDRRTAALDANPISPYAAVALASTADSENEYGLVLLVYANADAAQDAAAALDNRLAMLESINVLQSSGEQKTFAEIYNEAGTLAPAQVVTDDATGLSVVVVSVSAPIPSNEAVDGTILRSHLLHAMLIKMIYDRDLPWLVWGGAE